MTRNLTSLEQRIRAAKPEAPELPPDFASGVMEAIAAQGLLVRPAWRTVPGLWARRAAAGLALAAAMVLVNAALYELYAGGQAELLYFGLEFSADFLGGLPWDLIAATLSLGVLASWLLRTGRTARVRVAWLLIFSYGLSAGGGTALAGSGLNRVLHDQSLENRWPAPVSWFYNSRARYRRPHAGFRMGHVVSVEKDRALLETPEGKQLFVMLPPGHAAREGETLRIAGVPEARGFRARRVQKCLPGQVGRYFHHARMMRERMGGFHPMGEGMQGPMMGPMMGPMRGPMEGPMGERHRQMRREMHRRMMGR